MSETLFVDKNDRSSFLFICLIHNKDKIDMIGKRDIGK